MIHKVVLSIATVACLTLGYSAMSNSAEARGMHMGGHHGFHSWWNKWPYHNGHLRRCHIVHGWHHGHPVTFKVCKARW